MEVEPLMELDEGAVGIAEQHGADLPAVRLAAQLGIVIVDFGDEDEAHLLATRGIGIDIVDIESKMVDPDLVEAGGFADGLVVQVDRKYDIGRTDTLAPAQVDGAAVDSGMV